jgi:hypothetical protein
MSLFSFALLLSIYVNLCASSTPITSRVVPRDMSLDDSDWGFALSRDPISPPINLPLGQCTNFTFTLANGMLSADCDILTIGAGPPLGSIRSSVDMNECIANDEGAIVYRAE